MRRWLLRLAVLGAAGLAICWLFGSVVARPKTSVTASFGPAAQSIALKASDGVRLSGSYLPGKTPDAPAILLLHGVDSSRNQFRTQAVWLNQMGYAVLAIDFRGHGQSQQEPRSFGWFEARDARAAFDWLRVRQGHDRIGVIGTSLGGAAALLGEHGPLPPKALVLEAVYPDIDRAIGNRIAAYAGRWIAALGTPFLSYQSLPRYGCWPSEISPIAAVKRFHGPLFVIGGGADRYTPPPETRALFDAANVPKRLWIIPGYGHAQVGSDSPDYRARLGAFLQEALPIAPQQDSAIGSTP